MRPFYFRGHFNSFVPVPKNHKWAIWGWPNRFERRLKKVGRKDLLLGNLPIGEQSIRRVDDNEGIPENFGGIVWTNRIGVVGPKN